MNEELGELQSIDGFSCLVSTTEKVLSSTTGVSAFELMFGRDKRILFYVLSDRSDMKHRIVGSIQRNQFDVGQRVQARNYYGKDNQKK